MTAEVDGARRLSPGRLLRAAVLVVVLAVTGLVVPDAGVPATHASLVKVQRAHAVDVHQRTLWILAVGSDMRPGGNMLRSNGDALQLVGINTDTGRATSIGIPRDSWVSIPGHGRNRVNAALSFGGPQLLGETVGQFVGVRPDYVFVTRFPFFENMVADIGGISVHNPRPFSDPNLKPEGFKAGKVKLDGYGAMAFARIRKSLAGGDFDRSANQQRVLRGIHRAIRQRAKRPDFIARGVQTVMRHLHTDLPPTELYRIAQAITQVDPGKVSGCVVPGGTANIGGASVVIPNTGRARAYGKDARVDATIRAC